MDRDITQTFNSLAKLEEVLEANLGSEEIIYMARVKEIVPTPDCPDCSPLLNKITIEVTTMQKGWKPRYVKELEKVKNESKS